MRVREERSSDHDAVRHLVELAFGRPDEAMIVDRLRRDGDAVLSLVAADADRVIGHVMFSRMTAPFRALGLAPVAVIPDRQRQGAGGRLIRDGLDRARRLGWEGVFVLGEPSYYRRFGFDPNLAAAFTSPFSGPYLMALALCASLPAWRGTIEFAPALTH